MVVAVLLAGCNAPVGGTPEPALSPAPVPDDTGNDRLASGELAPGIDGSGVRDADRLADAHAAVLADSSYAVTQTISRTGPDGSLQSRYVTTARYAATPGRYRVALAQTERADGGLATREVVRYADGERVYEAVTGDDATRYGPVRGPDGEPISPGAIYPGNFTNRRAIGRLFALVRTTTTGTRVVNGTRVVELASTTTPPGSDVPPLRNVTLAATVTESGLVREYRIAYDVVRDDRPVHVVVAVEYRGVGTTAVAAPPWFDRASASG